MGSRCCSDRDEAVEKEQTAAHAFLSAHAWPIAAEGRWTHTTTINKRFFIGAVGQRLIPRALLLARQAIGADCERHLPQHLAHDRDNYQAKRGLKLLRLCQNLGPRESLTDLAVYLSIVVPVDTILYDILGYGDGKPRATIKQMATGRISPVCHALSHLSKLLRTWGPGSDDWKLLSVVHENMECPALKQKTRREGLQLAVGVVDQFERRMALPPHSLCNVVDEESSDELIDTVMEEFMQIELACLAPLPLRLRQQFVGK